MGNHNSEIISGVSSAFKGYQAAARAAKVLNVAHKAALGAAAASLVIGGLRAVKRFREE